MTRSLRRPPCILVLAALPFIVAAVARADTTYTWNNSATDTEWTSASAWSPSGPVWLVRDRLSDSLAKFDTPTLLANSPNVSSTIYVKGIELNNGAASWNITGTGGAINLGSSGLTVNGSTTGSSTISPGVTISAAQIWSIADGYTVTLEGALAGGYGLTTAGSGSLVLKSTSNTFFGGFAVNAGSLQADGLTPNAAVNAFRSNRITLGSGASFNYTGSADTRIGELSGAGTVNFNSNGFVQTVLADATSSATITAGSNGLTVRGIGTQTLTGNLSGIAGSITAFGVSTGSTSASAGLTLSGATAALTNATGLNLRGGALTLDNSSANLSDRFSSVAISSLGGVIRLVGNSAGSTETMGALTVNSGGTTHVVVEHNGGSTGTALTLSSFDRAATATGTINFVGSGGTLGSSGANPRITFTTAPPTKNDVIAFSSSSSVLGFATVNGTDFAGLSGNDVVAVSTTDVSGALSSASNQNSRLTVNASIGSSTVTYNTLKIDPSSSGQSLDLSDSGNLSTAAILLAGSNDFTIQNTGTGTGGLTGPAVPRIINVAGANTTLSVKSGMTSGNWIKAGAGFLSFERTSNQFSANSTAVINEGVLRATLTSLPNSNHLIRLRGGVLEIGGGGTLSRTLGTSTSGGINWDVSGDGTNSGSGGFSAHGGSLTVTVGNATWGDTNFIQDGHALLFGSVKADSRVTYSSNIGLDGLSSGSTGPYNARQIHVYDNTSSTGDYATISGNITGQVSSDLLKTGSGTLELTGNNTYSGNTIIAQGNLWANNTSGSQSSTGSGTVIVRSGATLGGRGTAGGAVFVQGGTLSPGDSVTSSTATLTVGNGVSFDSGSTFSLDIQGSSAGTFDQLKVTGGDIVLAGTLSLNFGGFTPTGSESIVLINNTGSGTMSGTFSNYASNGEIVSNYGGFNWKLYYNATSTTNLSGGNSLVLAATPVPEPAHILLACAAVCGSVAGLRRIRRRLRV